MLNRCWYIIRKCERKKLKINLNKPNEAKKLRRNPLNSLTKKTIALSTCVRCVFYTFELSFFTNANKSSCIFLKF